jgi:transcriptional regulator with XRE-family HTH domain
MVEIGETIKKLRAAKKMTQKEVGAHLNVTPQTISKWERNISQPDLESIVQLSELFQTSTDALLGKKKATFLATLFSKKRGIAMKKFPDTPSHQPVATASLSSKKQVIIFSVSSWMTDGELQTQRLQQKLQNFFTTQKQPIAVEMASLSKVATKAIQADLILLTPEAKFAINELQASVPQVPLILLDSQDYGLLNIPKIAEQCLNVLATKTN